MDHKKMTFQMHAHLASLPWLARGKHPLRAPKNNLKLLERTQGGAAGGVRRHERAFAMPSGCRAWGVYAHKHAT